MPAQSPHKSEPLLETAPSNIARPEATNRTLGASNTSQSVVQVDKAKATEFQITVWAAQNPAIASSALTGMAAVCVGLLTFFGVLLSLRAAHLRMRTELDHAANNAQSERQYAADQANQERRHSIQEAHNARITDIRKSIYLNLIEDASRLSSYLSSLPSLKLSTNALDDDKVKNFSASITKVWLVSEGKTAVLARAYQKMMLEVAIELAQSAPPMQNLNTQIEGHNAKISKTNGMHDEIIEELHELNSTSYDPKTQASLLRRKNRLQMVISAENEKKTQKQHQLNDLLISYHSLLIKLIQKTTEHADELILSARIELGLTSDIESLRESSKEINSQIIKMGTDMLNMAKQR